MPVFCDVVLAGGGSAEPVQSRMSQRSSVNVDAAMRHIGTSLSELFWAAVANSPAARSCSSLAATGFDLRVSRTALRAWV